MSEVIKVAKNPPTLKYQTTLPSQLGKPSLMVFSKPKPKLTRFLREICKEDLRDAGSELFGPKARKKIIERANTNI